MKIKFSDWIYWVLAFLPFVATSVVFSVLPNTIPVHFDSAGKVNRYGSRLELFIIPLIILAVAILFWIFFRTINKSTDFKNDKIIRASKFIVIITFNIICFAILLITYNFVNAKASPDLFRIVAILISLGDIIMANYLPKCKRNGLTGIRTTWTLKSDEVWYKTHRFGGWLIAIGGVLCIVVSLILKRIACLMTVCVVEIVMLIIVVIYSYQISKKGEPE